MYAVDSYAAVRRFVFVEGKSRREAARVFGLSRDTISKMCQFSAPPGYVCQSARNGDPGPACKKDPRGASFCSVQRWHPSVPAHASDEPSRGAAVKNGRFSGGRPQGLFLRAVSTAA